MKLMYYHVVLTMEDGSKFDGIIEDVDGETITVLGIFYLLSNLWLHIVLVNLGIVLG